MRRIKARLLASEIPEKSPLRSRKIRRGAIHEKSPASKEKADSSLQNSGAD